MRKTRFFFPRLLAAFTLALVARSAPAAIDDQAPADRAFVVLATPSDETLRNKVTGVIEVWTSDSNLTVGRASSAEIESLHRQGIAVRLIPDPGAAPLYIVAVPAIEAAGMEALEQIAVVHASLGGSSLVSLHPGAAVADLEHLADALHGTPLHQGVIAVTRLPNVPVRHDFTPSPPSWDARVQAMIDQIDQNSIQGYIDHLSNDYYTRLASRQEAFDVRDWLVSVFQSFGLQVTTQSYDSDSDNVIGELTGISEPDKIVIVGAHYDSVNWNDYPNGRSPGADDNGSGTAAVVELARVLSNYQFKYTLRFVPFCSEELGLIGSRAYAAMLRNQGADVVAMLNTDMNAYRASGDQRSIDFVSDYSASWLIDLGQQLINIYLPGMATNAGHLGGGTSDHQSFTEQGYPAVFYFEDLGQYSPYIHTANDTLGTSANDMVLSESITKAVCAALAHLAGPIDLQIQHTALTDQESSAGPYVVTANITSLISTNISSASVFYSAGSGFTEASMLPTGAPDEWIGQIPGLSSGVVNYYLLATDDQGNQEWLPDGPAAGDETFEFFVGVQDVIFSDDLETDTGWTHNGTGQDDWQRGQPQGQSNDPGAAYSGVNVWGNDLGFSGWNGEYANNVDNWLESPGISTVGYTGVRLRYRRWLAVEKGIYDKAQVKVAGVKVWENDSGTDHIDTAWALHDIDVSSVADNRSNVKIRFELHSDAGLTFGGWNIDDVELLTMSAGLTPELARDSAFVSLAAGGTVNYTIDLGSAYAGRSYVMLAGVSGTDPGFDLNYDHVPLNFDSVTVFFIQMLATLPGWQGTLDAQGRAGASLTFPPGTDASLTGLRLYTVAVTLQPTTDNATNPVDVLLVQ